MSDLLMSRLRDGRTDGAFALRLAAAAEIERLTAALAAEREARRKALEEAAALIRCDCCDFCGESPEFKNPCANVLAERIMLLAAGKPCSMDDARRALAQPEGGDG